jgi:ribonuclease HII
MGTRELFEFDKRFGVVAGVDEAGRGPLAGPVVCACCVMPLDGEFVEGINDSKKLSERKREELYDIIVKKAVFYHAAIINPEVIDEKNILVATAAGMRECVEALSVKVDALLIDYVPDKVRSFVSRGFSSEVQTLKKGDATSYCIAAASIIAKVTRDRLMREYAEKYPQYGFIKNKGYGTADHIAALKEYGASPIHRKTFITHFIGENADE